MTKIGRNERLKPTEPPYNSIGCLTALQSQRNGLNVGRLDIPGRGRTQPCPRSVRVALPVGRGRFRLLIYLGSATAQEAVGLHARENNELAPSMGRTESTRLCALASGALFHRSFSNQGLSLPPSAPAPTPAGSRPPVPTPKRDITDPRPRRRDLGLPATGGKGTLNEESREKLPPQAPGRAAPRPGSGQTAAGPWGWGRESAARQAEVRQVRAR